METVIGHCNENEDEWKWEGTLQRQEGNTNNDGMSTDLAQSNANVDSE